MRAENYLGPLGFGKAGERIVHLFDDSVQIQRITIESLDAMNWNIFGEQSPPLIQARARCGGRILRIQRQEHHLVALRRSQLLDRLVGEGMPVAHGHETVRIDALIAQFRFQSASLLLGMAANWRASSDGGVVMLHFARAGGGNQLGKGLRPMRAKGKSIMSGSQKRL